MKNRQDNILSGVLARLWRRMMLVRGPDCCVMLAEQHRVGLGPTSTPLPPLARRNEGTRPGSSGAHRYNLQPEKERDFDFFLFYFGLPVRDNHSESEVSQVVLFIRFSPAFRHSRTSSNRDSAALFSRLYWTDTHFVMARFGFDDGIGDIKKEIQARKQKTGKNKTTEEKIIFHSDANGDRILF